MADNMADNMADDMADDMASMNMLNTNRQKY